jgi:hypothetical protein
MVHGLCNHTATKKKGRNKDIEPAEKNSGILLMLEQMHIQQLLSFQQMCEQPQKRIPPFQDNK